MKSNLIQVTRTSKPNLKKQKWYSNFSSASSKVLMNYSAFNKIGWWKIYQSWIPCLFHTFGMNCTGIIDIVRGMDQNIKFFRSWVHPVLRISMNFEPFFSSWILRKNENSFTHSNLFYSLHIINERQFLSSMVSDVDQRFAKISVDLIYVRKKYAKNQWVRY